METHPGKRARCDRRPRWLDRRRLYTGGAMMILAPLGLAGCVDDPATDIAVAPADAQSDHVVRAVETGSDAKSIPFLKRFTVFNVAQCEGLSANTAVRGTDGSLKRPGLAPDPGREPVERGAPGPHRGAGRPGGRPGRGPGGRDGL